MDVEQVDEEASDVQINQLRLPADRPSADWTKHTPNTMDDWPPLHSAHQTRPCS